MAKRLVRGANIAKSEGDSGLYDRTDFRPWIFAPGDKLDFPDNEFTFVYSEHVLEHFRYDIAVDLFAEVFRTLKPGGVVRTVVPDPDYRVYEPPERVGYPSRALGMDHPNKHKVRWNVYLLARTLEMLGFEANPIVWCSDDGTFHENVPSRSNLDTEPDYVSTLRYVQRPRSLIVDGVKRH
jgi:predicted SAM-dependent methyltransferase